MTLAMLAEGSDGYAVGFMVSELDPQFGARTAIVALTRGDAPLVEDDGPWRVVVPNDPFHARWVRGVVRLHSSTSPQRPRAVDARLGRTRQGAR